MGGRREGHCDALRAHGGGRGAHPVEFSDRAGYWQNLRRAADRELRDREAVAVHAVFGTQDGGDRTGRVPPGGTAGAGWG